MPADTETEPRQDDGIDGAIGSALRRLREECGMTARQLAEGAAVSAAMVSRIENGQVSPSISTLSALSKALDVPLVSLFRETASVHADCTHVRKGEGLRSTRTMDKYSHAFVNLAFHKRRDLQLEAHLVTLAPQDIHPPTYVGRGVVFIHVLDGEAVYGYGNREIALRGGDSLSLAAELAHGFNAVLTDTVTFLSVQAEMRR